MKNTYYVMDSTIFSNDEDMFFNLRQGETVINDDADVQFNLTTGQLEVLLMVTHKFTGKKAYVPIHLVRADVVAEQMDRIVDACIKDKNFFDRF